MFTTNKDTIIFDPDYNEQLDMDLITQYKEIIFSDYKLSEGICEAYENNIFKNFKWIGSQFNQEVDHLFLSNTQLTHLTFGYHFNQEVTILPQQLTHLTFGSLFNQEVANLPPLLTHLTFGYYFNQQVENLPPLLTHLTFGDNFNQEVTRFHHQLTQLTHLTFGRCFNQEVNLLPPLLIYLTFGYKFNKSNIYLPLGIKYLKLNCNNPHIIAQLSSNIEVLELDYWFDLELNDLPTLLKEIIFNENSGYNKELNCLPKFVEQIQLPKKYDKQIKNLPRELKKVICSSQYKYKYIDIEDFNNLEVETY